MNDIFAQTVMRFREAAIQKAEFATPARLDNRLHAEMQAALDGLGLRSDGLPNLRRNCSVIRLV